MTDKTITQLPVATSLTGAEAVPIMQAGVTVYTTTHNIAALASGGSATSFGAGWTWTADATDLVFLAAGVGPWGQFSNDGTNVDLRFTATGTGGITLSANSVALQLNADDFAQLTAPGLQWLFPVITPNQNRYGFVSTGDGEASLLLYDDLGNETDVVLDIVNNAGAAQTVTLTGGGNAITLDNPTGINIASGNILNFSYTNLKFNGSPASLVAGAGIAITGTWPNQTVTNTGGGGSGPQIAFGQFHVAAGVVHLVTGGSGFDTGSLTYNSVGNYQLNYSPFFGDNAAATVTLNGSGVAGDTVIVSAIDTNVSVLIYNNAGTPVDRDFCVIAIGPPL